MLSFARKRLKRRKTAKKRSCKRSEASCTKSRKRKHPNEPNSKVSKQRQEFSEFNSDSLESEDVLPQLELESPRHREELQSFGVELESPGVELESSGICESSEVDGPSEADHKFDQESFDLEESLQQMPSDLMHLVTSFLTLCPDCRKFGTSCEVCDERGNPEHAVCGNIMCDGAYKICAKCESCVIDDDLADKCPTCGFVACGCCSELCEMGNCLGRDEGGCSQCTTFVEYSGYRACVECYSNASKEVCPWCHRGLCSNSEGSAGKRCSFALDGSSCLECCEICSEKKESARAIHGKNWGRLFRYDF